MRKRSRVREWVRILSPIVALHSDASIYLPLHFTLHSSHLNSPSHPLLIQYQNPFGSLHLAHSHQLHGLTPTAYHTKQSIVNLRFHVGSTSLVHSSSGLQRRANAQLRVCGTSWLISLFTPFSFHLSNYTTTHFTYSHTDDVSSHTTHTHTHTHIYYTHRLIILLHYPLSSSGPSHSLILVPIPLNFLLLLFFYDGGRGYKAHFFRTREKISFTNLLPLFLLFILFISYSYSPLFK